MIEERGVALISGASRGIGAATARELGRRGRHVVVNYHRDVAAARSVVTTIESAGGTAEAIACDVRDSSQVDLLVDKVHEEHGRIDVLVCNANTAHPPFEPLVTVPWSAFSDKVLGELSGVFFLTQRVFPIMRGRQSGRIVYVSSIDAEMVGVDASHSIAKAALNTFSRHVASEAAQYGITVNAIAPGGVSTDANARFLTPDVRRFLSDRSVFRRVLEPPDIGRLIGQVVDDDFGVTTGQVIRADGGFGVLGQQL